jgi:hypothetical protein
MFVRLILPLALAGLAAACATTTQESPGTASPDHSNAMAASPAPAGTAGHGMMMRHGQGGMAQGGMAQGGMAQGGMARGRAMMGRSCPMHADSAGHGSMGMSCPMRADSAAARPMGEMGAMCPMRSMGADTTAAPIG